MPIISNVREITRTFNSQKYVTALSSCNGKYLPLRSKIAQDSPSRSVGGCSVQTTDHRDRLFSGMDKMSPFNIAVVLAAFLMLANAGDMMRKSIVFDKNTPDVFYCPQRKPTGFDKLIVHSRPLSRLCQFEGGTIPQDYKSDCYNDVDETEYACKEKYRIMKRFQNVDEDREGNENGFPNA